MKGLHRVFGREIEPELRTKSYYEKLLDGMWLHLEGKCEHLGECFDGYCGVSECDVSHDIFSDLNNKQKQILKEGIFKFMLEPRPHKSTAVWEQLVDSSTTRLASVILLFYIGTFHYKYHNPVVTMKVSMLFWQIL